ncbi:PEP-CTERM/exosortase system-associated acyltransferase [Alkalimonas collagenimarina]|uniref:PEP-CTERM/exosortase system-associated acyltransferase n=1 Tax=Alkalimonas collagenimarina TaxID=400390 RepID=A0ABT9GZ51_9GAMM|nr:PEP-CTERM/exosortase system-associated acyltransferase [Alkalimonas collagenimarina]MDP4536344.1 PEP-CTERM/exosortase system-associated acyltransferase [Alkalimonas collagenimarina]
MKKLRTLAEKPIIGGVVKRAMTSLASNDAKVISRHFSQYLRPQIATDDDLKHEVYRLRHQVYCEELHFEDVKESHEECDEFDDRAIHCFVRHLGSKNLAGTVRLIGSNSPHELLPLEQFCGEAIDHPELSPANFPRHSICEISRLAVPENFRKRAIDQFKGAATGAINEQVFSETELRCFPYIAICLYLAATAMAMQTKRYHGFVMMEPRLARSLTFVGIKFQPIGKVIEFHGKRAPYYIDARELRNNLSSGYLKLLESVEHDLILSGGLKPPTASQSKGQDPTLQSINYRQHPSTN